MSTLYDIPLRTLDGAATSLGEHRGKAVLVVNVASKCGLTPQYEGLERLQKRYGDRGFTVLGMPCNQFGGQEPGSAEEIATFCSATYGVSFPLLEKADVNGADRHPLYAALTAVPDADGEAGDITWNFEKFLVSAEGEAVARFRPRTDPEAAEVTAAIEGRLRTDPASGGGPARGRPRPVSRARPGPFPPGPVPARIPPVPVPPLVRALLRPRPVPGPVPGPGSRFRFAPSRPARPGGPAAPACRPGWFRRRRAGPV